MLKKKKECTICKLKQYLFLDIFFLHIFGLQYHRPICLQPHLLPGRFLAGIGSSILTALQCWLKIYFGVFLNWISDQDLKLKFTLFERQVIYRIASSCSECEKVRLSSMFILSAVCARLHFELFSFWIESQIWGFLVMLGPSSRSWSISDLGASWSCAKFVGSWNKRFLREVCCWFQFWSSSLLPVILDPVDPLEVTGSTSWGPVASLAHCRLAVRGCN